MATPAQTPAQKSRPLARLSPAQQTAAIAKGAICPSDSDIMAANAILATHTRHDCCVTARHARATRIQAQQRTAVHTTPATPSGKRLSGTKTASAYGGSGAGSVTCPTARQRSGDAGSASQL